MWTVVGNFFWAKGVSGSGESRERVAFAIAQIYAEISASGCAM